MESFSSTIAYSFLYAKNRGIAFGMDIGFIKKKTPMMAKLLSLIKESASEVQEAMSDIIWSINPERNQAGDF